MSVGGAITGSNRPTPPVNHSVGVERPARVGRDPRAPKKENLGTSERTCQFIFLANGLFLSSRMFFKIIACVTSLLHFVTRKFESLRMLLTLTVISLSHRTVAYNQFD